MHFETAICILFYSIWHMDWIMSEQSRIPSIGPTINKYKDG
jgi:hypothetical protein